MALRQNPEHPHHLNIAAITDTEPSLRSETSGQLPEPYGVSTVNSQPCAAFRSRVLTRTPSSERPQTQGPQEPSNLTFKSASPQRPAIATLASAPHRHPKLETPDPMAAPTIVANQIKPYVSESRGEYCTSSCTAGTREQYTLHQLTMRDGKAAAERSHLVNCLVSGRCRDDVCPDWEDNVDGARLAMCRLPAFLLADFFSIFFFLFSLGYQVSWVCLALSFLEAVLNLPYASHYRKP